MSAKGWKEAATAIAIAIAVVALLALLTGCTAITAVSGNAEYEHHSSIPDFYDKATTDQLGYCVEVEINHGPLVEGCIHDEVGGGEVFGKDPVGTIRLKKPLHRWER